MLIELNHTSILLHLFFSIICHGDNVDILVYHIVSLCFVESLIAKWAMEGACKTDNTE